MSDPFRTAYYDAEATAYDETRGGADRARAAAEAVLSLAPPTGICVDVAGGTGIVSAELAAGGLDVLVADRSAGMLAVASARLPGRLVACDADRLPFADGSVDLVTMIWLLHLLPVEVADSTVAEAVRVLGPQGHLVTTVDKARIEQRAQRARRDDLAHVATRCTGGDGRDRVTKVLAGHGLVPIGSTSFFGATRWPTAAGAGPQEFALVAFQKPD